MLSLYGRQLLIRDYLSDVIEGVQHRALGIICPKESVIYEGIAISKHTKSKEKKR